MTAPSVPELRAARPRWRQRRFKYPFLYACFLLMTVVGCTDRLILYPSTEPRLYPGIQRHNISLSPSAHVEVWTARSAGGKRAEPEAYVLAFIGNADRGESMALVTADDWGDRPVEVWAVNYPGYGASTGPARLRSIPPAALAAYDDLSTQAKGRPIFVAGQSLGTTAALYVAANRPVAGCVLRSPPPLKNLIFARHGWWNLWLLATPVSLSIPSDLDSPRNGPRIIAPAVFVETGNDSVVPLKYQKKVESSYGGPKQVVLLPDSEHNDPIEGDAVRQYEAALDWLWERALHQR